MDKKDRKEGPLFLAPFVNAPSFSQYRIFEPYVEKQIQRYEVPPDESQSLTSDLFDFDPEIHLVGHKPGDLVLKLGDQQYLIIYHPGRGNTSYDPGNGEGPIFDPNSHITSSSSNSNLHSASMENIEELRTNTFVNGSPMNTVSPSIVSKNFILSNSGIVPFGGPLSLRRRTMVRLGTSLHDRVYTFISRFKNVYCDT